MLRALVFGATGQVARELGLRGAARGAAVTALGRAEADLADPEACAAAIAAAEADVVINAAAYTAVDRAESEPELAADDQRGRPGRHGPRLRRPRPALPARLDRLRLRRHARAGPGARTTPRRRSASTARPSSPARRRCARPAARMRSCAPPGCSPRHGANFVKTMLRLGAERDSLRVVDDQIGGPTPARAIAEALLDVAAAFGAGRGAAGVFHFAGAPALSWADFAARSSPRRPTRRRPGRRSISIPSRDYPTPARRPLNSVLDCGRIARGLRHRPAGLARRASTPSSRSSHDRPPRARASCSPAAPARGCIRSPIRSPSSCCRSTTSR